MIEIVPHIIYSNPVAPEKIVDRDLPLLPTSLCRLLHVIGRHLAYCQRQCPGERTVQAHARQGACLKCSSVGASASIVLFFLDQVVLPQDALMNAMWWMYFVLFQHLFLLVQVT